MRVEPFEVEELHPRPSSARPMALTFLSNYHDNGGGGAHIIDRLWTLIKLTMELHPITSSVVVFLLVTVLMSVTVAVVRPHHNHGPARNKLQHDYSEIQYGYNFRASQLEHWCMFGDDDSACQCEDFTDPMPRTQTPGWSNALARNQKLVADASRKNTYYDVVVLGDDTVEIWTGQWFGLPVSQPNGREINRIWNETFTRKGGGLWEGLALGIKGDSASNLMWRLQHGERPLQSLRSKVWWIFIGGQGDLVRGGCSEEAVVLGILRVAEEVHFYHPEDVVVVQGLLPRTSDGTSSLIPKSLLSSSSESSATTSAEEGGQQHGLGLAVPALFHHMGGGGGHGGHGRSAERLEEDSSSTTTTTSSTKQPQPLYWPSIERINAQLSAFCEKHTHMVYFDASKLFLGTMGNEYYRSKNQEILKDLMSDYIHPSVQGMEVLATRMAKELNRIINEEDEGNDIEQQAAAAAAATGGKGGGGSG